MSELLITANTVCLIIVRDGSPARCPARCQAAGT